MCFKEKENHLNKSVKSLVGCFFFSSELSLTHRRQKFNVAGVFGFRGQLQVVLAHYYFFLIYFNSPLTKDVAVKFFYFFF